MKLFLDFETRSKVDLRKRGADVYARDASTSVLCLAWAIDDGDVGLWVPNEWVDPELFDALHDDRVELHAHNAAFERAIWEHCLTERHDAGPNLASWPKLADERWHCTAARCAALALPRSLDGAAKALGLDHEKDMEGNRLMLQLSKPRKPSLTNPDEWWEPERVPEKFQKLYDYCVQDVVVERAVHHATPEPQECERDVWLLDQKINDAGVPVDLPSVSKLTSMIRQYSGSLCTKLSDLTGGAVTTGRQTARLAEWLTARGVNLPSTTESGAPSLSKESVAKTLEGDLPEDAREVLQLRQELSLSSTAKLDAMIARSCDDGRVRGGHLYHGAATGRWAGRGVQVHNIPRGKDPEDFSVDAFLQRAGDCDEELFRLLYGSLPEKITYCLRGMIRAEEGKRLIVCDFAGIEARVLAWLAGEEWLLEAFRDGRDIYKEMASQIYGVPVSQVSKSQRQVGKIAILGLGYQMGAANFKNTCEKFGVFIDDEMAQRVVDVYRGTNSRIKRLWWGLNDAAIESLQTGCATPYRGIYFGPAEHDGRKWLLARLPSGRRLAYYDPLVQSEDRGWGPRDGVTYMSVNGYTQKWERTRTYGGKLTENIVQAIARDFLVEAMRRLEAAGYTIVMHVHDEVVCEEPDGSGSIEEVERIMCDLPPWGRGCPIGAEGFEARRYRK